MYAALITALLAGLASLAAISLTKQKEREIARNAKKLAYFQEFFGAASGIAGSITSTDAKVRFATAVNNLHLIGSFELILALHVFCDEISESNPDKSRDRHDILWSKLVWQIRSDLNDRPTKRIEMFKARLWASGV